jgi:hypothetical protein
VGRDVDGLAISLPGDLDAMTGVGEMRLGLIERGAAENFDYLRVRSAKGKGLRRVFIEDGDQNFAV